MTWKSEYAAKILNERSSINIEGYPMRTWGDMFGEIITHPLFMVFILVIVVPLIIAITIATGEEKNCAKYEYKIVHQEAWTQFIWMGKFMSTIHHPAGDYYQNVCTQSK